VRILMLAQFYPPTIGGEERYVRNLSLELTARGHEVAVATFWQEGEPHFECDQGVRIYRIRASMQRIGILFSDKGRTHAPPFPDPEVLWALRRIILHEHPDIVHAHNWIVHSFTPLKSWSKAKLVVTLHDCSSICAKKRYMYHDAVCNGPGFTKCLGCAAAHYGIAKGVPTTLANWTWSIAERHTVDMFLPVSQAIAKETHLDSYRVPYRVIPNFVPDNLGYAYDDADPRLAQLPQDGYLLFVGDLARDKGVEVLLRAHVEMDPAVPLVLIGRLLADSPTSFPPNVHILQSWPHTAVISAWRRCTIALTPSIVLDACPTVTMEAMVMERPVIASSVGGLPDIVVDGETGLLVPPDDWEALYKAIRRLLQDPALRERMGRQGKQRVIQFQAQTVVPGIEHVYQELIQSK
jgi:glycosyltransferase involved in cell wall biosynthesis